MTAVVLELQRDALDRSVLVTDLLRRALVVARKLRLDEFQHWAQQELDGYADGKDIPGYRTVTGQVRGWNPYRGWVPILFADPMEGEIAAQRNCSQSIAELEHLIASRGSLHMPFSQDIQHRISSSFGYQTEVSLFTDRTSIVRIVDAVRNIILNWALKLEDQGILGEGLTFTAAEREAASNASQHVTNFYGPVHGAQIQQGGSSNIQVSGSGEIDLTALAELVRQLRIDLVDLNLSSAGASELTAELTTIEAQLQSPKPKLSILQEGLRSVRQILEGATGSVAAHFLLQLGRMV